MSAWGRWFGVGLVLVGGCGRWGFTIPADGVASDATLTRARSLAVSDTHTCAIRNGVLSCWGANANGELGTGDTQPRLNPTIVMPGSSWRMVGAGLIHTCAIDVDGFVWCWGGNNQGQLGTGDLSPRPLPTQVTLPALAIELETMSTHTCVRVTTGELMCWGENAEGQLGQGDVTSPPIPHPVTVGLETTWTAVSTGQGHTLGLLGSTLYGTGRNSESELGLGATAGAQLRVMTLIDAATWRSVSAGQSDSCGVRIDGGLWCWGSNSFGECGTGDMTRRDVPAAIAAGTSFATTSVNTFHGCAIETSGAVRCWGRNVEGQLGTGDVVSVGRPTLISGFTDWSDIKAGRFYTCGQRADASVWCTGENNDAQLGTGDVARRMTFTEVALP